MSDADAIWRKHKDELIRYATVLVGPDQAEDVLMSVVARVLRRRGGFESLDDPRPYLFKSVLNEARDLGRRSRRVVPVGPEVVHTSEPRPDVLEAVRSLPDRQRAAMYLAYWHDLPLAEVAQLMGCRVGTVKRYLHLARIRLKEALQP